MATPLDLEEQEQLDQLKHFWAKYGNLITLTLVLALGGFAKQLSQFKNKNWVRASAALLLALYALYTIAIALAPRLF